MATTSTSINSANKDIDYIQRDFNSSVDAIIDFATVNFGSGTSANRLWTDFNVDSFSRNWLEIVAFIADVFFFYFDNQATQSYLQTATVRSAIKDIAAQFGFVPSTATSASGNVTFTFTGAGTISRGFRVSSSNGQEFFLTSDVVAPSSGDFTGNVLQGIIKTENFVAEGIQSEELELAGPNVIRDQDNSNPFDITPQLTVAGNEYSLVDSFIRHNGEDSDPITDSLGNIIGGGGRVFTLGERANGTPFIRFGDGVFGRKLEPGENITITYRTGGGSTGNIGAETLTTLVDSSPVVSAVTNNAQFSGGADEQSIEQLRELIPASLRTLDRAVAEQDYSDLLVSSFTEVFAASTEPNTTDAGVDLNVYVVPQGVGITAITDNSILLNRLSSFLDRRKMVTIQFSILDAFGVDTLVSLEVFISDTASRTTVSETITSVLEDYFDLETGGPSGTGVGFAEQILLKDITNIIEEVDGVERFEIKKLTYRPRIQVEAIGLLTEYNTTDVTVFSNVGEYEWLAGAAGSVTEVAGGTNFSNDSLIEFTYTSGTGSLVYAFPVDLGLVAPGDLFKDTSGAGFTILAIDDANDTVYLQEGLSVDDSTPTLATHGSIENSSTSYESFKVFRKILATATNLAVDSITDNNLDLSIASGTGSAISARELLDNSNIYIPGEFSTGDFYLVDSASNIWDITSNTSNKFTTSITAVNDASVVNVSSGDYKIVQKLVGSQIVFSGSVFNIQYNSEKTLYSIGAQFSNIGTIGDSFEISDEQSNIGTLGVAVDLVNFDSSTGNITLNSSPDLSGITPEYKLIDSDEQEFDLVAIDNRAQPFVQYEDTNQDDTFVLEGSGLGSQLAQGFEVTDTNTYAVVSMNLKREGNILGNLTARIVADDGGGLPDLSSIIATSDAVNIDTLTEETFEKVIFSFVTPPSLTASTQYHLVLSADAAYASAIQSGVTSFNNSGLVDFSYNSGSGVVSYASTVNLSSVQTGHFFKDSSGTLFKILAVDDGADEITLDDGLSVDDSSPSTADDGSVVINDRISIGLDSSAPSYADGEFSRFDGSLWSNSSSGPSPSGSTQDAIFSVEGTKSITINSNLTPTLGTGATLTKRYFDDENQLSMVIGISNGSITSASDITALGTGTVSGVPNSSIDTFVFRTSRFADDIVNLRLNEIPTISADDITLQIFGGIE